MNPGLKEYDLSSYKGLRNKNFFLLDKALQKIVDRYSQGISEAHKQAMLQHITKYGELVGGILNELTEKCHREGKYGEIQNYDSVGNRIDEVVYSVEQVEARRISYEHGVVNLDLHKTWNYPFLPVHRYVLAYLMNLNGEGGVSCPLAMTEGMIEVLQKLGTESQKERFLPIVAGENSKSYFYAGQYVTERVGGSNVGANRTIAKKLENGKWLLNGEKWFCSNPGDLWVTTAKIEGTNTIGLFLVSRYKSDGSLNGHKLIRKKDIIGSRGKLTAEVIYEDVEAEELGRVSHGLANLIKYVITISRVHVGIGATGNSRRAIMEAVFYAKHRTAYGKGLLHYPIYTRNLVEMCVLQTVITLCNFKSIDYWKKEISASDVTIPLMKYKSSAQATDLTHKAILCLGGNGIIGDFSPLPRMHNDSIINETWEGTHFLLTEHVLHALERRRSRESFFEELEKNILPFQEKSYLKDVLDLFYKKLEVLKNALGQDKSYREIHRVQIADLAYECFALSEVVNFAAWEEQTQKEKVFIEYLPVLYKEILTFGCGGFANSDSLILNPQIHKEIISTLGLWEG